jgi:hypothetical protein
MSRLWLKRIVCLAGTLLLCVLLGGEAVAAANVPAPNKGARPPAGQVLPGGKKKSRRPSSKKPTESPQTEQPVETTTSQPAETADGRETIALVLSRLARTRRADMSDRDIALKAVLEFVRALGRADGQKASGLLEVTGYQIIPGVEELPDEPGPRISPEAFGAAVAARQPAPLETLPADCVEPVPAKSLRDSFPVVSAWMLPTDWAILLKPVPDRPDWVHDEACLVIRVRANKPTIQGGTALDTLLRTAPPESAEGKP